MAWKNSTGVLLLLIGILGGSPALSKSLERADLPKIHKTVGVRPSVPRATIDIVKKTSRLSNDTSDIRVDIDYSITVLNSGNGKLGKDSMFLVEQLPGNLILYNGVDRSSIVPSQIKNRSIIFEGKNSGLNFDVTRDVRFSNQKQMPSAFKDCNYRPVAGYDPAVRHICLNPKGVFAAGDPVSQFTIHLRTSVKP